MKSWDEMCTGNEYFGQSFMQMSSRGGTFIDGGAWTGDTVKLFSEYVDGNYKRIHAFELDEDNFHILQRNTVEMHDVVLHHAGVGEENERITYFVGSGDNEPTDGISLMKQGGEKRSAKIVRLDDALKGEQVTFIKMDIEGSEVAALRGAEEILRAQKPQLAVCVYHKTSDFWEIPVLIRETNPDYKLYLRHHYNRNCWGTVLYGV